MTELSFSKQFLATLASRPVKLPTDYTEDPRNIRSAYQLPKTLPPKKKPVGENAAKNPTVSINLKPLRPMPGLSELPLTATPLSTTILTLKAKYSEAVKHPVEKLRVIVKGKPLADVKTLQELGYKDGDKIDLMVMVMGGGAGTPAVPSPVASPAPPKAKLLQEETFWEELGGFLKQRCESANADEDPEKVLKTFRAAWTKGGS